MNIVVNPEDINQCLGCGMHIDEEFDHTGALNFLCHECSLEPCENCGYRLNRDHGEQRDLDQLCDSCGQSAFPSIKLIKCNSCGEPFRMLYDPNGNIIEICGSCENNLHQNYDEDDVDDDDNGAEAIPNPEEDFVNDDNESDYDSDYESDDEEMDVDDDDMIEVIPEEEPLEQEIVQVLRRHERLR